MLNNLIMGISFACAEPSIQMRINQDEIKFPWLNTSEPKKCNPVINSPLKIKVKNKRIIKKSKVRFIGCMSWSAAKINEKATVHEKSITKYSTKYGVDKNLIKAVITVESCFRVKVKSHADAHGLMQLIPATAKRFGVKDSYNADQNIMGGTKYLNWLLNYFNGNVKKMLAGYNAGEGRVDQYNGIPPYKETQDYVVKVLHVYNKLTNKKLSHEKVSLKFHEKTDQQQTEITSFRGSFMSANDGFSKWKAKPMKAMKNGFTN